HHRRDGHRITSRWKSNAVIQPDDRSLGEAPEATRALHEVAQRSVRTATDAVEPGHERERRPARVVGAGGLPASYVVQTGGDHLDERLIGAVGDRIRVVYV